MASIYTVGIPKLKNRKWDLIIAVVVLALIFAAYLFLRSEGNLSTLQVDNTNNQPQAKVIGATDTNDTEVSEIEFAMTLPGEWGVWEDQGGHEPGVYRYEALSERDNGRYLEVYVDSLPKSEYLYMTHMLPVRISQNGKTLEVGTISDLCRNFAPIESSELVGVYKARWKEIEFDCDVHRYRNIVGTASIEDGYSVPLGAEGSKHTFFFHYTDHGSKPNNSYLTDIIRTFVAR